MISYRDHKYTNFQTYIDEQGSILPREDLTASYAFPIDGSIIEALNATPVKALMAKIIDFMVSYRSGQLLTESVPIDHYSFPELFDVLSDCAKTLGIPVPYAVVRHFDDALFNAYTTGTDDYSFILISSGLCDALKDREAHFVLGHECGHIAARHVTYQMAVGLVTDAVAESGAFPLIFNPLTKMALRSALLAWSRYAEITSDRAGLICCGDLAAAERALIKVVIGLGKSGNVDIDDYLRKAQVVEEFHSVSRVQKRLSNTHPSVPQRIKALQLFADSEIYYEISGKARPSKKLLGRDELNQRVGRLLKA